MLIVIDVGNTNIKCGLFEQGKLRNSWRMATKMHVTSDEIGIKMISFLDYLHLKPEEVENIMISSVIPSINYTIEHMLALIHISDEYRSVDSKTGRSYRYSYRYDGCKNIPCTGVGREKGI